MRGAQFTQVNGPPPKKGPQAPSRPKVGGMFPGPSGLQEVDGLNGLLCNHRPDHLADKPCPPRWSRLSHPRPTAEVPSRPHVLRPVVLLGVRKSRMIFTASIPQISRTTSPARVAASPTNTGFRYLVAHTKCGWIPYTVCAPHRYSAIP